MSQAGPASRLFDANYNPVDKKDGDAFVAADDPIIPVAGTDGNDHFELRTDSSGRLVAVGAGTAGTPAGGVVTVQGDPAGEPIPVTISPVTSTVSSVSRVAQNAASVVLLAAVATRIKAVIVNDSSKVLYVLLDAAAASATNYTYKLPPDGVVEIDEWDGEIRGIWSAAGGGAAQITELTP